MTCGREEKIKEVGVGLEAVSWVREGRSGGREGRKEEGWGAVDDLKEGRWKEGRGVERDGGEGRGIWVDGRMRVGEGKKGEGWRGKVGEALGGREDESWGGREGRGVERDGGGGIAWKKEGWSGM
ncbi:hypothetical protein Pcinc_029671 [Petrolisthes cinctipes]|uniref:Uncharacterized protein n=1 Tax=Petrolisthes cinctipes TaxID=88211 RepID=A0AAE1EZV0_PETCI|nr:hypothetical protein Pcinc_029671 [Petrolisthes cinctipes]